MTTQERIDSIKARVNSATPAPWYVNFLDDSHFMNLVAVTTIPDSGKHEALLNLPDDTDTEIRDSIIATTLIQAEIQDGRPFVEIDLGNPNDVDFTGYPNYNKWDEDAEFIAHAREDIPWLLAKIEELQQRILEANG